MGSGNRITWGRNHGVWFGFGWDYMPFAVTMNIGIGTHYLSVGLGKAYDEYENGGRF